MSEAQVLTTLGALIAPELAADPSRVAVVEASRHVTFAELDHEADRVAAALIALGLKSGDRVLLWMASCAEWLGTALGIARAGCTLVTLDAAAGPSELARALGQTHAKVVFLSPRIDSTRSRKWHRNAFAGSRERRTAPTCPSCAPWR
ncbi:MAG: AMP-binding protein [bacterium]